MRVEIWVVSRQYTACYEGNGECRRRCEIWVGKRWSGAMYEQNPVLVCRDRRRREGIMSRDSIEREKRMRLSVDDSIDRKFIRY